jgi:hypothetical protein
MTIGDEPMLPQPSNDNAPMISGRGTKVIADARGAYRAGNLQALIDLMNEKQKEQLHQAIELEASHIMQALLDVLKLTDPDYHPVLPVLRRMIVATNVEDANLIFEIFPEDPDIKYGLVNESDELLRILTGSAQGFARVIKQQTNLRRRAFHFRLFATGVIANIRRDISGLERRIRVRQWLYDAAWAILQRRNPPPFPELPS